MILFLFLALASTAFAASTDAEFFEKRVRPLLASKCYSCHGEKVKMGGLSLSSTESLSHAVDGGVIVKGDPEKSRLYRALLYTDDLKMPPTGKLGAEEIGAIRSWIEGGATLPGVAAAAVRKGGVTDEDRKHWAFQPIAKAPPPAVKNTAWVKSPIDAFLLKKLEEKQIPPPAPASKYTLLRRVTYDLTGLPPTTKEIDAFVRDASPDAFAKVVDRLLASPRYGERWGRHWLDVARYADSTGMDEDNIYPHAWRYRDYVVDAFNRDTPYDRFVKEQLAGDVLPAKDAAERARNAVATGFLAIGPRPLAQQDRLQMVYDVVDEQIDTTTKALLGLTVACARCHDHKFDPIPTKDYYGLASIFASTTTFRNQGRPGSISYMFYTPLDQKAYDRYQAHQWRTVAKQAEMEDALAEDSGRENAALRQKIGGLLAAAWKVQVKGEAPAAAAAAQNVDHANLTRWVDWLKSRDEKARAGYLKNFFEATEATIGDVAKGYQESYSKMAAKWDDRLEKWRIRFSREALQERGLPERPKFDNAEDPFFGDATFGGGPMDIPESARVQYLRQEWEQLKSTMPETPALASAAAEGPPVAQRVFMRGSLHSPGEPVEKHFPVIVAGDEQPPVKHGSGRLEFAEWLTSGKHPLPARVMVNRMWQWHFGEALVRTPNNWGTTGEAPTHPALLDYLAQRFMDEGWSIKKMHRLMLLSSAYQMSGKPSKEAKDADPGNRLFSRFNRVRMSVEQMRDTLLAMDASIDTTMGGSLFPQGKGKRVPIDASTLKRRTLYLPVRRGNIPTLLSTFDFGDATTASEGRSRTNVAPQALFLMNSQFVVDRSRGLAGLLLNDPALAGADRVRRAYLTTMGRPPDSTEVDAALSYVASLKQRLGSGDDLPAWTSFCHALVAANEFLYLE